jgi:hypothetical protein
LAHRVERGSYHPFVAGAGFFWREWKRRSDKTGDGPTG